MSKYSHISKQLWELSMIGIMGLTLVSDEADDTSGELLSGDLLLDLELEALDYQDHRELFTGPAAMSEVANAFDDWFESSDGPVTTHMENLDSLREELGWSTRAGFGQEVPVYNPWDESWESAAALENSLV